MIAISDKYEILGANLNGGKITVIVYDIPGGIQKSLDFYFKTPQRAEEVFLKFCESRKLI